MRTHEEVNFRDESGRKQCVRCGEWFPPMDFYPLARASDGHRAFCRFCASKEDSVKRHHLGMPAYDALVEKQDNSCAICGINTPYPDSMWTIDHDHNCCSGTYSCGSCIRGLICRKCNMALGLFNDSVVALRSAAYYLETYNGG